MNEEFSIQAMSCFEFNIMFAAQTTPLSSQYAAKSVAAGMLLKATKEGEYLGYMCLLPEYGKVRIAYAYTVPEYRRRGVFTALMEYVTGTMQSVVRFSIAKNHEYYDTVVNVCRKLGYRQTESASVYICHDEALNAWDNFYEKRGKRLCSHLERKGYRAVCFADAGEDLREQIRESSRTEYANMFDPAPYLDVPENRISWEMSYAAVKNSTLAAYTLATRLGPTKYIVEQISEGSGQQGSGVILLPFAAMMKAFKESECRTVSYAMYGSNTRSTVFHKVFMQMKPLVTVTENYCSRFKGSSE